MRNQSHFLFAIVLTICLVGQPAAAGPPAPVYPHLRREWALAMRAGNLASAMAAARLGARQGDTFFQHWLWGRYFYGRSGAGPVERNIPRAFYWLRRAAAGGDSVAQSALARELLRGEFIARDDAQSFRLAASAARSGFGFDLINLSRYHRLGIGTRRDEAEADHLLRRAIAAVPGERRGSGDKPIPLPEIYFRVARPLICGRLPQDLVGARKLLSLAAVWGHRRSARILKMDLTGRFVQQGVCRYWPNYFAPPEGYAPKNWP